MRCRVDSILPEYESVMLIDPMTGDRFAVPISSHERDGRLVRDSFERFVGRSVWLSLQLA